MTQNNQFPPDIQRLIDARSRELVIAKTPDFEQNPRELVIAKTPDFEQNPREVLKDKKIKRYNNISRLSEESDLVKVSDETCLLAETSSLPIGQLTSSVSLESGTSCQGRSGNVINPRELASRVGVSAVSVQHSKTTKGIKAMVTIQTVAQAKVGEATRLTAELKRWDRLRELKPYADDSDEFADMYLGAIEDLKNTKAKSRRSYCIGRLHDRGARSAWYADMMMLGILDDQGHLKTVILNIEGQEFEIDMNLELSDRQTMYHSQGRHGDLKRAKAAPRLSTAPSEKF
jgi:hypothetical protein